MFQERELKRQQAVMIKEQVSIQFTPNNIPLEEIILMSN